MGKVIGIDLGTTNSVVSVIEGGLPTVITNSEGNRTTPSVVAFSDDGEQLVGTVAKRQSVTNHKNTIFSAKRFIGRNYSEVSDEIKKVPYEVAKGKDGEAIFKINDKTYTPQEISARVLQKMKKTAEEYLGEEVKQAVITVPAYFNDDQRQNTKDAGTIAGLEVLRVINEPTAAALAYGLGKDDKNETIVVYDLGGGTFDVSILELGDGVFEVKSTNGDTHLGGDDFDEILCDHIAEEFKKESGIDVRNDPMALQRLRQEAEKAKCELSTSLEVKIEIPFITADASGPKHLNLKITRAKFESLIKPLVDKTKGPCLTALNDAGVSTSDIGEVILVGGSTRIPLVQQLVKELFGREPHKGVNPDEVVAMGAAIQGGVLNKQVTDVLLLDVTPLSLGIETEGDILAKIIEKNTTIPCRKSQTFSTASDNQPAVTIKVYQGERQLASKNKLLGEFNLEGIPPAPRGVPQIEVTFDIDVSGIVHISAKDLGTGKEQKINITASNKLDDTEIKKMQEEAALYEEEDKKIVELSRAKNESESLIYSLEKMLDDPESKVEEESKEELKTEIQNLKDSLSSNDVEIIKEARSKLEKVSHKMAEQLYKSANPMAGEMPDISAAFQNAEGEPINPAEPEIIDAEVVDE